MAERTVGWSPNPNKANILKESRDFQTTATRFSAAGMNAMAKSHTGRRNAIVLESLLGLSALASSAKSAGASGRLREVPTASASCTAALLQRHSYPQPDQAAHFMPGQLRLNGVPVWEFVPHSVGRLYVMDMFADVERLHANFNRADSAAEDGPGGLKALAGRCAALVAHHGGTRSGGRPDRQFVWNVYSGLWLPGVQDSLNLAVEKKLEKPQVPTVTYRTPTFDPKDPSSFDNRVIANLAEIEEAGNYEWNIRETLDILRDYQANATAGPGPADVASIAERAEAGLRGYESALEK